MKKILLCSVAFSSLLVVAAHGSMTEGEMKDRTGETQGQQERMSIDHPTSWADPLFSSHLVEVFGEKYDAFNDEFGDGKKSKFVQTRNKIFGGLGEALDTGAGRKYAIHQLKENPGTLTSDPHTWAEKGIAEAEKHLGIANRLSNFVFEKYFPGKPPLALT